MSSTSATVLEPAQSGYVGAPYASRQDLPYSFVIWNDGSLFHADSGKGQGDNSNAVFSTLDNAVATTV